MLEAIRQDSDLQQANNTLDPIDLGKVFRSAIAGLMRQWLLLAVSVGAFLAVGLTYLVLATPTYTATARMIIDPRVNSGGPDSPSAPVLLLSDALIVDSEVEVLRSRELADKVIDELDLVDQAPDAAETGVLYRAMSAIRDFYDYQLMGEPVPTTPPDPQRVAERKREEVMRRLLRSLNVTRSGNTYVIDIAFNATNPYYAANVANTFMDEYFSLQAESTYENTRRVSDWLTERVGLLGTQVQEAEKRVQDYQLANNLFSVRNDQSANELELSAANDQLIAVKSSILTTQSTLSQLDQIIANGSITASIDPDTRTTTLTDLQAQYAELVGRERDLSSRFGSSHQLAVRAREEIAATQTQINEEFQTIRSAVDSRLSQLRSQETEYNARIAALRTDTVSDAQGMIQLRELEREANSARSLYESMLGKLNEINQQESFRSAPARVIAQAAPPDRKSAPNSMSIMLVAAFGGLALGSGIAFLREQLDGAFRRAESIEEELGTPLIGVVPNFATDRRAAPQIGKRQRRKSTKEFGAFSNVAKRARNLRFAVENPGSLFTETMRSLSFTVNSTSGKQGGTVVAITSVNKGEGKSTLSANYAAFAASMGSRVVLIDLDLHSPSLTAQLEGALSEQRVESLQENPALVAALQPNPVLEGAAFVGNGGDPTQYSLIDVRHLQGLEALLGQLRLHYDLIVIDLPPLASLVDAKVVATVVNHVVLAVEWGVTSRSSVRTAIMTTPQLRRNLLGAVFTKVKLRAYNRYNTDRPSNYYGYSS